MSYNAELQQNNAELEAILSVVNELPTGSSSVSTSMPLIRFIGARDKEGTMILSDTNPLNFTVEIIGGGALQVGDKLQICVRRTYGYKNESLYYKKQKLRQMVEIAVTEEDLNRRFLTVSVSNANTVTNQWLFKNDRLTNNPISLSPIYLRIKRITKYNTDGDECDATFSNVVTVWKTYNTQTNKVAIK